MPESELWSVRLVTAPLLHYRDKAALEGSGGQVHAVFHAQRFCPRARFLLKMISVVLLTCRGAKVRVERGADAGKRVGTLPALADFGSRFLWYLVITTSTFYNSHLESP
jgi:hypothetical protein